MASFTLQNSPFPNGTSVGAYDATGYSSFPAGGPPGKAVDTATVSVGKVTFDGLTNHREYFAAAKVGSNWKSWKFTPGEDGPPPRIPEDVDFATREPGRALVLDSLGTGYVFADLGRIDVTDVGAVGDGETDDTAVLEAVLAAGGRWYFPEGTYRITAPLEGVSNTELELGPGAVIDGSELPKSTALLNFTGTEAAEGTEGYMVLTADAENGDREIEVADPAEFEVEDWVRLGANTLYAGNPATTGGVNQYVGEMAQIEAIEGDKLTLSLPLYAGDYLTENEAWVARVVPVENVAIRGPGELLSLPTQENRGIFFTRCINAEVSGLNMRGVKRTGVAIGQSINVTVDRVSAVAQSVVSIEDEDFDITGTAYGVSVAGGSRNVRVTRCFFRQYRHAITCSGGVSAANPGINRDVIYALNQVADSLWAGIDCHSGVQGFIVTGNHIYWTGARLEQSGGLSIRCNRAIVANNHIVRPFGYGIWVRNQTTLPTNWVIQGNIVEEVGQKAIRISSHLPVEPPIVTDWESVVVSGNTIRGAKERGIEVAGHASYGRARNVAITGNAISEVTESRGIHVELADGVSITGNSLYKTKSGIAVEGCTDFAVTGNRGRALEKGSGTGVANLASKDGVISANVGAEFEIGVHCSSESSNTTVTSNRAIECTTPLEIHESAADLYVLGNQPTTVSSNVASAEVLKVPFGVNFPTVTGTVEIKEIAVRLKGSEPITLRFSSSAKLTDGGNLKLAGSFEGAAERVITLRCDGTNWYEMGRSSN